MLQKDDDLKLGHTWPIVMSIVKISVNCCIEGTLVVAVVIIHHMLTV